jgi:predicted nucleic acid-binding protein
VIVVDCSYTMAMVMPDERRPHSLAQVEQARLVAPPIWAFEVANAFFMAVRRGRLVADDAAALSRRLEDYDVSVEGADATVHRRFLAARTHDTTAYDAAYLDLAQHRRFGLATLDRRMADLARRLGLVVHD